MAEIIEFPKRVTPTPAPQNSAQAWEERALASLKTTKSTEDVFDEGILGILSLFEQEVGHPKDRGNYALFLFEQMFDPSLSLDRRESLAAAVAALFATPEHNSLLMPKIVLGSKEERIVAAIAMGFAGNHVALSPLQNLLKEEDLELQKAAAFGLSGLKDGDLDHKIIDIFLAQLSTTENNDLLSSILINLKLFASPRLEPVFISFTHHSHPDVRKTALGGLLFSCGDNGLDRTLAFLEEKDDSVRAIALSVLERHGSRKHLEAVLPLMGDKNPRIRQMARETLSCLRQRKRRYSHLSH